MISQPCEKSKEATHVSDISRECFNTDNCGRKQGSVRAEAAGGQKKGKANARVGNLAGSGPPLLQGGKGEASCHEREAPFSAATARKNRSEGNGECLPVLRSSQLLNKTKTNHQ